MTNESRTSHLDVERVLRQLTQEDAAAPWQIQLIGQGNQAQLFLASGGQASAGERVQNEVVVKLYRERTPADRRACANEKCGLEVLSKLLPRNVCDGWLICSPTLLHASEQPLALAMSSLPGVPLDLWLHSHAPTVAENALIVEAVLTSLQVLWAQGFMYGDLNLKNILYEAGQRQLSFIDPGAPLEYYLCEDVVREWFPMSRDIAYLLFSVAVSVRRTLGNPAARRRQQLLVYLLVQKYLETLDSKQQQARLLDEIRLCVDSHLRELNCDWSPSGIWRRFVKQITHRSLYRSLDQLAAQVHEVQT